MSGSIRDSGNEGFAQVNDDCFSTSCIQVVGIVSGQHLCRCMPEQDHIQVQYASRKTFALKDVKSSVEYVFALINRTSACCLSRNISIFFMLP